MKEKGRRRHAAKVVVVVVVVVRVESIEEEMRRCIESRSLDCAANTQFNG